MSALSAVYLSCIYLEGKDIKKGSTSLKITQIVYRRGAKMQTIDFLPHPSPFAARGSARVNTAEVWYDLTPRIPILRSCTSLSRVSLLPLFGRKETIKKLTEAHTHTRVCSVRRVHWTNKLHWIHTQVHAKHTHTQALTHTSTHTHTQALTQVLPHTHKPSHTHEHKGQKHKMKNILCRAFHGHLNPPPPLLRAWKKYFKTVSLVI